MSNSISKVDGLTFEDNLIHDYLEKYIKIDFHNNLQKLFPDIRADGGIFYVGLHQLNLQSKLWLSPQTKEVTTGYCRPYVQSIIEKYSPLNGVPYKGIVDLYMKFYGESYPGALEKICQALNLPYSLDLWFMQNGMENYTEEFAVPAGFIDIPTPDIFVKHGLSKSEQVLYHNSDGTKTFSFSFKNC